MSKEDKQWPKGNPQLDSGTSGSDKSQSHLSREIIEPWKASFHVSVQSQRLIKNAATNDALNPIDRASRVLKTFLSIPPEECNAANLVCALTLSAKIIGSSSSDEFRSLLFRLVDILALMVDDERLSARQLCNVAWAIAKHYDRDERILPSLKLQTPLSSDQVVGSAETWDVRRSEDIVDLHRLDALVDKIAQQLTTKLEEDALAAKEGELCMASWAYGVLRPRQRPTGWKHGPRVAATVNARRPRSANFIKFESWTSSELKDGLCDEMEPQSVAGALFDAVGLSLTVTRTELDRVSSCRWSELANLAWAYAAHGRSCSIPSQELLLAIANEAAFRLRRGIDHAGQPLSRDIAQVVWSFGSLQSDNFRLADGLTNVVDALVVYMQLETVVFPDRPFQDWSAADIVQVAHALAHARLDELVLLEALYEEAECRLRENGRSNSPLLSFHPWELSILLWAQARLNLKEAQGSVFRSFPLLVALSVWEAGRGLPSFDHIGIRSQEQANMAWSLTVLEIYDAKVVPFLARLFAEAAKSCDEEGVIHLEHAHQLWQALFLLENDCPNAVGKVPVWFRRYLQEKWNLEKGRIKVSSARHRSLSHTLTSMGIAHVNEHDEDIDVAIVLRPQAMWTHQTVDNGDGSALKLAVEFDGPNHFTRPRAKNGESKPPPPRTLGHTVLKYRLLKKQGWTVVRVPYYEFDKIPFWASMERQRYLQRLLKTHGNIQFSKLDVSEYKTLVSNRKSRFD